MTDHPAKGMTPAQVRAFERIAVNAPAMAGDRTIEILMERGLIESAGNRVVGRDCFGEVVVPDYRVPLGVHWQWCEWCSEQPELALEFRGGPGDDGEIDRVGKQCPR